MEDIFKSGLLGLVLIGALVLASINTNEVKNNINENTVSRTVEIIVVEDAIIIEKDELTHKDNFHTPL